MVFHGVSEAFQELLVALPGFQGVFHEVQGCFMSFIVGFRGYQGVLVVFKEFQGRSWGVQKFSRGFMGVPDVFRCIP